MTVSNSIIESRPIPRTFNRVQINDSGTSITLVAAATNGTCHVWGGLLFVDGITDLTFLSDADDISGPLGGGEDSGPMSICLDPPIGNPVYDRAVPHFSTAAGKPLKLGNSEGVRVSGYLLVEQTAT